MIAGISQNGHKQRRDERLRSRHGVANQRPAPPARLTSATQIPARRSPQSSIAAGTAMPRSRACWGAAMANCGDSSPTACQQRCGRMNIAGSQNISGRTNEPLAFAICGHSHIQLLPQFAGDCSHGSKRNPGSLNEVRVDASPRAVNKLAGGAGGLHIFKTPPAGFCNLPLRFRSFLS